MSEHTVTQSNTDEQSRYDDPDRTNAEAFNDTLATADERPCERCNAPFWRGHVGPYPHPATDGTVWRCLRCWSELVAEHTLMTEREALVIGGMDYAGFSRRTVKQIAGISGGDIKRTRIRVFEKSKESQRIAGLL